MGIEYSPMQKPVRLADPIYLRFPILGNPDGAIFIKLPAGVRPTIPLVTAEIRQTLGTYLELIPRNGEIQLHEFVDTAPTIIVKYSRIAPNEWKLDFCTKAGEPLPVNSQGEWRC